MSEKTLSVFAGPNGSGKSTIQELYKHRTPGITINTDDLALEFGSQVAGAREALKLQKHALANKQSFSTETTLSGNSALNLMRKAKEQGYRVILYYVCTSSVKINEARIKSRVALGGHNVPADDIKRRYDRSLQKYGKGCIYCYDNLCF